MSRCPRIYPPRPAGNTVRRDAGRAGSRVNGSAKRLEDGLHPNPSLKHRQSVQSSSQTSSAPRSCSDAMGWPRGKGEGDDGAGGQREGSKASFDAVLTVLAPTNTRTQAQAHTDKTEGHGKGPPPTSPATRHTDTATQMAAPPTAMRALTWPRRPASPAGSGACRWQPPCRPW